MLTSVRGTVRHPRFDECVEQIASSRPQAREAINGAVWQLQRNPEFGVHIKDMDVWQARLLLPDGTEVLLHYCLNRRYVYMLTITEAA